MTTELKEKIVRFSRNGRKRKWIIRLAIILVITMLLMCFLKKMIIVGILAFLGLSLLFIDDMLDAIEKQKDKVLEKNKLLHIVLSESRVVERVLIYFVEIPIISTICNLVEVNFFIGVIIVIIAFVGIIKLTSIITRHFKNKLSE